MAQVLDYDHLAWAQQCMLGQMRREAVDQEREREERGRRGERARERKREQKIPKSPSKTCPQLPKASP